MTSAIISNQKGSLLIGLVATLGVFAALGVAVVSMTTGSTFSQLGSDTGTKAFYLAESGVRYLASEFRNASGEVAQDNRLGQVHGQVFTLDGEGSFRLQVFPWYMRTTSAPSGTSLQAQFPGGAPAGMAIPANGHLRIRNESTQILSSPLQFTGHSLSGNSITFTMTANLPSGYDANSNVSLVGRSPNAATNLVRTGTLTLASGSGGVFPPVRGTFIIEGDNNEYSYEWRVGDSLQDIRRTADPGEDFTITVPADSFITPMNYLDVTSTGIHGQTERTVDYSIAIGRMPGAGGGDAEFIDTFENLDHWAVGTGGQVGSHAIQDVGGDSALAVTSTQSPSWDWFGLYERASLLTLRWDTTEANLQLSWQLNDYLLSYDAQVKMRVSGQDYYMPGIVFRVDGDGQMYGVSYLRADTGTGLFGIDRDRVPDELCPLNRTPMIVLWQNTNAGRKWLAYKTLSHDDGVIASNGRHLVDWSTLMVRVIEADALEFYNGQEELEFKHGEIVVGETSGAEARVIGTPILTGGSWADSDAEGWLTVTNVSKEDGDIQFETGENLLVDGVFRAVYTGTSREKDNYIRVYYGRTTDQGSANDDPLDNQRHGNPRITSGQGMNWPVKDVSDWDEDNDHFTLVQWNNDMQLDSGDARLGTGNELNAIIRTSTLNTPNSGTFTRPEIGLDTWGSSSTSVRFDDFGLTTPAPGMRRGDLRPAFQRIK